MSRNCVAALVFSLAALPISAFADPPFQLPPESLPLPGGRPQPWQPTPHFHFKVTYSLSCTVGHGGVGAAAGTYVWTVRNYGSNTAPAGLAFQITMGGWVTGPYTLSRALAPDDTADFGARASKFSHPFTNTNVCEVNVNP